MSWTPFVVLILIFGLGLWAALKVARSVQRAVDAANKKAAENKKKQSPYHWVWSSAHSIGFVMFPAVRYVYRAWRAAPRDSFGKLMWGMALAAIVALALWFILKFVDWLINREPRPVTEQETAY